MIEGSGDLMRVSVFGAENDIGRQVVEELLCRGYTVRVFVTDPTTVPVAWGPRVQLSTGRLTDPVAVGAAVAWGEAVVNAHDPRLTRPGAYLVEGTGVVVAAMARHGVRRYIGLGSPAVGLCPSERPTARVRVHRAYLRVVHPRVHHRMQQMMTMVTGTGLDWTLVRFLRHTGGRGPGLKYVGYFGHDDLGCCAAAGDIAAFAVTQLLDTRHVADAPAVSN
ncbi:NAD(P)-dependent oxidoreductase [Kocuria oceani]|uniref:NAD(P)-dependent oxidoreductase n=1 Tax=Kocuria oceani TaxID=988827 RepID=A0ABV9TQE2_9MICC|nr:NAD(P)H-binding protein [Kocuria oceani]